MTLTILVWFILRHCVGTCADGPYRSACYRTGTFNKQLEGHILQGHVISTLSVNSIFTCSHACVKHINCSSFNYEHESLGPRHLCELNNCALSTTPRGDVVVRRGFSYYEDTFLENGCSSSPCLNGGVCNDSCVSRDFTCSCTAAIGKRCELRMRSCKDWFDHGLTESGVYVINPDGLDSFSTYCDHVTSGAGWTVFQRRRDGSENFNRSWAEYRTGFGSLDGEFWLGNEKLHRLTHACVETQLRVDIADFAGDTAFALYDRFSIANETGGYRLSAADYRGTAGDSLISNKISKYVNNGMKFTTRDRDNDALSSTNCGDEWRGGWWFNACFYSFLNGEYQAEGTQFGVNWCTWKNRCETLKSSEMKLRCVQS